MRLVGLSKDLREVPLLDMRDHEVILRVSVFELLEIYDLARGHEVGKFDRAHGREASENRVVDRVCRILDWLGVWDSIGLHPTTGEPEWVRAVSDAYRIERETQKPVDPWGLLPAVKEEKERGAVRATALGELAKEVTGMFQKMAALGYTEQEVTDALSEYVSPWFEDKAIEHVRGEK